MQYNMMTSNQQTLPFGEDASMSSQEDSHANRSRQPGSEKAQKMTAISGRKCCEQFAKFAPAGSWARMFSELLIGTEEWYSNKCTLTWKLKGTRFRRLYFQLAASAPPTDETAHGSSPMLLKTPSAMDARAENLKKKEQRFDNSGTLAQEVQTGFIYKRGLLPTVQTQGLKVNKNGKTAFMPLGLLPTPTANDGINSSLPASQVRRKYGIVRMACQLKDGTTSQLNPLFVQEMMGFEYLWTELPFAIGEKKQSQPTETR